MQSLHGSCCSPLPLSHPVSFLLGGQECVKRLQNQRFIYVDHVKTKVYVIPSCHWVGVRQGICSISKRARDQWTVLFKHLKPRFLFVLLVPAVLVQGTLAHQPGCNILVS